jgi:hypothetical protein
MNKMKVQNVSNQIKNVPVTSQNINIIYIQLFSLHAGSKSLQQIELSLLKLTPDQITAETYSQLTARLVKTHSTYKSAL